MVFDMDITRLAIAALAAVAVGGIAAALAFPLLAPSSANSRLKALLREDGAPPPRRSLFGRIAGGGRDSRRRQVQETLKQIEERERRRKDASLRVLIARSGQSLSVMRFYGLSALLGAALAAAPLAFGVPWYACAALGAIGAVAIPRRILGYLGKRRQEAFLDGLADAVDAIIRGLKAGLPLSDAMRVIASETGPPVGPEFLEIVEGQRLGVSIDQGLERLAERMPLPEVIFLSIVVGIQSKSGGNLAEALGNLSRMLRERKKLKNRIRSASQEAKTSAMIIGSLPFLVGGGLMVMSPGYLAPFFETAAGNLMLAACLLWMLIGVLIMRKMINFRM
ncbi:MAG: type II secretion system F family protein [Aestuariivirga sp.]|uniref:type II secretion system F family protein n=1 Tax=Aestuariivirga sp. TaxID=2650926 RepID=UPI0038D22BC5